MRKLVLTGAVACYAAFIGLASACGSDADSTDGTAGAAAPAGSGNTAQVQDPSTTVGPRVRLRLTGQLEGYLEPCGCAANQVGGLSRRAFKLREDRNYDLLVEGGNLITTATALDFDKLLAILQVLNDPDHRYDVLAVGPKELELADDDYLFLLDGYRNLSPISSDLQAKELDGIEWPVEPFTEKHVQREDGSDVPPATVRFASLTMSAPEGYTVLDPAAAWQHAMEGVDDATFRVALIHATTDKCEELAGQLAPRPDLVVGMNGAFPEPPRNARQIGDVPVVYPGTRGRALLDVHLARDADGKPRLTRYHSIQLAGSQTAPGAMQDPDVDQLLLQHRQQVKEAGLREEMANQLPTATGATYVGSATCAACHISATAVWKQTRHGNAWATLEKAEGSEKYPWPVTHYPDCVGCHVVGYQEQSGFVNPEQTPHLQDVGCESCHGPGSNHIANPAAGGFVKQTMDQCMRCHTYEQTPAFAGDYPRYWKMIEHGLDK